MAEVNMPTQYLTGVLDVWPILPNSEMHQNWVIDGWGDTPGAARIREESG